MMRNRALGVVALVFALTLPVTAQPFATQIQIAINQLITGVTAFSTLRTVAGGYWNFGATSGASGYGLRDNAGTIQAKNSAGAWLDLPSSATLPTAAPYITRTTDPNLSNEFALGSLASGLILNTTTTGVPTIYTGTACTNQFPRSLSLAGLATCASVSLTTDVTGALPVTNGGTGLTLGVSGGVPAFTGSGTMTSSGLLTQYAVMVGGGAGVAPTTVASIGSTTTLLHGNAAGPPSFGAAILTTDVSGILPSANGGTGSAYFAISGPTALRTFTFPNANATILTSATAITPAQGGTGITSYTIGDLIFASGATTLSKLADASTGNALIAGGVGAAPLWGKIGLATHVSGTLGVTNGGTGFASYTIGDILIANGGTSFAKLADVATGNVLRAGGVGVTPAYGKVNLATDVTGMLPSANGGLQSTTVTLTNAQIKALPTTSVAIVAAPGAGFQVRLIATTLSIDTTAGAYTNINAMYADLHGTNYTMYGLVDDSTTVPPLTVVSQFLGAAGKMVYQVSVPNQIANGSYVQNISVLGYAGVSAVPLELFMDNNGSGNLTGGNAANSLKVTVYYVIEAL